MGDVTVLASGIAQKRTDVHLGHDRQYNDTAEISGVMGEMAFALRYGLKFDDSISARGDAGYDFVMPLAYTVDIKTAAKPTYLICYVGKVTADIYVLAKYSPAISFIGWEWGKKLAEQPTRDFGRGVQSHYILAEKLRPMSELDARAMIIKPIA